MAYLGTLLDTQIDSVPRSDNSACYHVRSGNGVSAYRCLVADDDPTILRLVAEMLSELSFQVDTAEDGRKAFDRISAHSYDLVVTDLEMPEMNGFLLASRTKHLSGGTKTVIMTGRCHAEVFGMMSTAIVDAWLFKPFGLNELCQTLDDLKIFNYKPAVNG